MRLSKTVNGQKTTHIWDGANIVLDLDNAGAVKNKYIRGNGLIAFDDNNNARSYYLKNAHGDITQLANQSGTVTKNYSYDAFGVETNPDLADKNPFRYAGEYYDQETKSIYLRARYYSPSLGRFGSVDTHWNQGNMVYGDRDYKEGELKQPEISSIQQSANLYVYGINNPVIYIDKSGQAVWLIHGTWSNSSTWKQDVRDNIGNFFQEECFTGDWEGENNKESRSEGAQKIANEIIEYHNNHPDEPIRLVGHSHGGNVAIMVVNILAENAIEVDTLITIATPVRKDYQLKAPVGQHLNVYTYGDSIQIKGGSIWRLGDANRIYPGAENVRVSIFHWGITGAVEGIDNHSRMHSDLGVWEKYINPKIKKEKKAN